MSTSALQPAPAATMTTCRACRRAEMLMFLPLGDHPPANAFVGPGQLATPDRVFPLNTHVCLACGLIQVPNVIPPDYFRHYLYVPSASATMHGHFAGLAAEVAALLDAPDGLVVDIGCNDGLFLGACQDRGLRILGIDPATNLIERARERGIAVLNEYFNAATAVEARQAHGPASIIVTTNTFNHIDDLHEFMRGVAILLADGGRFIVEVPHALDLVNHNEFDTVYHEHVSEFAVKSFVDLYDYFDMVVVDIQQLTIHGGSMRIIAERRQPGVSVSPVVERWLERERAAGLFAADTYRGFRERVEQNRDGLMAMLRRFKAEGKRLAGYGAPAKGSTLLNYYGIGPDLLDFLADRNSLKQGLYSPGTRIPIVGPERILQDQPDYLVVLAWNFADEIIAQQQEYTRRGGRFILPIPEPRVVG
jgi:SAM-dependent methyltransferase